MVAAIRTVTGNKLPGGIARQLGQREARGEAAYREKEMYKAVKSGKRSQARLTSDEGGDTRALRSMVSQSGSKI